ncbi:MAG: HAMP domain-containing sensor histidine kinase [Niabella sp.]
MRAFYRNKNFFEITLLGVSVTFFILSFVFKNIPVRENSLQYQVKEFERQIQKQQRDAEGLYNDTALVKRLATARETLDDVTLLYNKPYSLYLYKLLGNSQYLRFWSTSHIIIPDNILEDDKEEQFVHLSNGWYYIKKKTLPGYANAVSYYAILIEAEYHVISEFLNQSFPLNNRLDKKADISLKPTAFEVKSLSGKTLFYLKEKPNTTIGNDSVPSVVMRIISLFFIFFSLYLLCYKNVIRRTRLNDILLFVCCMLGFRIVLYAFSGEIKSHNFELFNPEIYGSNFLLPTLGDLLINSWLFCWCGVFIWNRTLAEPRPDRNIKYRNKKSWGVFLIVLLILLTFTVIAITRSIITDSKLSFDVTNFFSLNIYTAVGFIILAFLSLGFYYFSRILYNYIFPIFDQQAYWIYFIIAGTGLLYIGTFAAPLLTTLYIFGLLWLLLYTFLFQNEENINKLIRFNISGIVVRIFIFSVSISILMLSETSKVELAQRKLYVEKLATQSDPATERLMNIANSYLDNDFFEDNFFRLYDSVQNKYLRDSILSNNYFRYVSDYSGALYLYDSTGKPLFNPANLSLESLNTIVFRQSNPTGLPDLYSFEPAYDRFAYITYRQIRNDKDSLLGTVCIVSQPKKFSGATLSPELFRQKKEWEFSNSTVYNYAIYSNKLMVASSKKYPFTSNLLPDQLPKQRYELRDNNGYNELWYRATDNIIVVMTRKTENVLETITLFSYIFCTFLFLVALIQLVSNFIGLILTKRFYKRKVLISSSIRGQIHSTFILITVLSFVVIGIATISFFTQRFDDSNSERLGRTMSIMLNEMQSHKELGSLIYDLRIKRDTVLSNQLEEMMRRVSDIQGVDANIYDVTGRLLASSLPDVYSKGVLSTQIDPRAYYYLFRLRHIEHTQKEMVADLKYTSIYAPLRNKDGSFYAYLSIPYFTSQQQLNQEISSFLVTLINLNAFIFLTTGLVALLITNRITRSFTLISEKMTRINLSRKNEMIEWHRNDEIGGLVTEYNKMVSQLQESADALAKSERQEAWREMARQVAHEIKNPLTPMKLSLQYLQKAINENNDNVQMLTVNVSKTLVEQIDHLSKIAADFSHFANIDKINNEIFDLHSIIQSLVALYSKNPDVEFHWNVLDKEINIFADKTQMNRVFTNLFTNAIEACDDKCILNIDEQIVGQDIIISITDNGGGISEEMRNKIFTPNFTTKSSGTGLGLAMCKTIIEKAGGQISFDTEIGRGTTFIIKLPITD